MCRTSFYSDALPSLQKRDAVFTTSEATPLPARPLNHLSVLSYLAIGVVVFATSLVTGYLIHSCWRSASRKEGSQRAGSLSMVEDESVDGGGRRTFGVKLELKPLHKEFRGDEESFSSDSKTVIGNRSDTSFDKNTLTSVQPQLADGSAPQKQKVQYSRQGSHSLSSPPPSASFFSDGSPPGISPYSERRNIPTNEAGKRQGISSQFDSNNIRYIPPLAPCVTDSTTVKLYNEPKLFPVHGSTIPHSPTAGDNPLRLGQRSLSVSRDGGVRLKLAMSTPSVPTGLPRLPESSYKENVSYSRAQSVTNRTWVPTMPKPGPGYF